MFRDLFSPVTIWDRVYITTLFTFNYDKIIKTINFYKDAVGGTSSRIYVGGIMASLMLEDIFEDTGIYPFTGLINSPKDIDLEGSINIDQVTPDYEILDNQLYAVNDTYYAYTTRGCVENCAWCGVSKIEPEFVPYINIKPTILELRKRYGDKHKLKLMDNNVFASDQLDKIVEDLLLLGYGKDDYTDEFPKKKRVIDFNQGVDATYITEEKMKLISNLCIKPMRIAFDLIQERDTYEKAVILAKKYGVVDFSNYMLFNFHDTPKDLYDRIVINIKLNEKFLKETCNRGGTIYSYPMRYAPITDKKNRGINHKRDVVKLVKLEDYDWLRSPVWTKRFLRNIEIMKGAAHGAISTTPTLAWRTIGNTFEDFITNLYMPEELLRNRNKHEKRVYKKGQEPGTGRVEAFRKFILKLLKQQDQRFAFFHNAVSDNFTQTARDYINKCKDKEMKKWLTLYLRK